MIEDNKQALPEHTKLRYEECYAKVVLERAFPEIFSSPLQIKDRPDLQSIDGQIGVEVTSALPQSRQKISAYISKISRNPNESYKEEYKKKIEAAGGHYGFIATYPSGSDSFGLILKAIEEKVKKLNKPHYNKEILSNYLYVKSDIYASEEMVQKALEDIGAIQNSYNRKFDLIFVMVPENFYIFDCINKRYKLLPYDSAIQYQDAMAARKMVLENE